MASAADLKPSSSCGAITASLPLQVDRLTAAHEATRRATTLSSVKLLRGIKLDDVLHNFGRIFQNSKGCASSYDLSKEVEFLDIFLSHNWSTPRIWKFMALAMTFNFFSALLLVVACLALVSMMSILYAGDTYMLLTFFTPCMFVFPVVLVLAHEVRRLLGLKDIRLFLDKACIHQVDDELKQAGVASLGAFLSKSTSMVIIYNDEYLKKLWTVYEVASLVIANSDAKVRVLPVFLVKAILAQVGVSMSLWVLAGIMPSMLVMFILVGVSIFFSSIGGWITMRAWAKKRKEMYDVVEQFDIRAARCFHESDRAYVESNVASFMIAHGLVSSELTDDECMDFFNEYVKEHVPRFLNKSLPRCGVPYKFAVMTCIQGLVLTAWSFTDGARTDETLFWLVMMELFTACITFIIGPIFIAVASMFARRSLQHGICGNIGWFLLANLFGNFFAGTYVVLWGATTFTVYPIRDPARSPLSAWVLTIIDIAFVLANVAGLLYFYRPAPHPVRNLKAVPNVEHKAVPDVEHKAASDVEHIVVPDVEHKAAPDVEHEIAPDAEHNESICSV